MKKIIGVFLTILIGVSLLPLFINMSDDYNVANVGETFTATEIEATVEVVTVSETPIAITKVTVNGAEVVLTTDYTVSGSAVTLLTNETVPDDIIVVYYSYEFDTTTSQDVLVDLIPTLIIIMIVAGLAYAVYKGKN